MKKVLIFFGAISLVSCKKFLDVNTDPNQAEKTQSTYVFTNAQARTGANQVGGMHILGATWTGQNAHSTSFSGGGTEKTYSFTNSDFNFWDGLYDNLTDYQYVINNAAKDNVAHLIGPAMVMQAIVWQQLVDLYGDVPYTEALKGTALITPKFDDDQFIYEDLIKKIDTAIGLIKSSTVTTAGNEDILYLGTAAGAPTAVKLNKTTWVQFANTVKMRILMRQSFVPGRTAYITTEINKIIAEGSGFITNNIFINPGYSKAVGKLNPFYVTYGYTETDAQVQNYAYRKTNAVAINWLKNTLDTFRLQRLAYPKGTTVTSNNLADYVGVPLGAPSGYLEANTSSIGSFQITKGDANRPLLFFTEAEKWFLLAEAAQRYGIAGLGVAQTNYTEGVRAAFRQTAAYWASTSTSTAVQATAAANAYLARDIAYASWTNATSQADLVRTILIQKWISLMEVNGLEAWSDYRKSNTTTAAGVVTAFGSVPTSPHSINGSAAAGEPVRLYYPLREESTNGSKVPQGVNVFTSKIFWDVN